jgi:hypothetical protein
MQYTLTALYKETYSIFGFKRDRYILECTAFIVRPFCNGQPSSLLREKYGIKVWQIQVVYSGHVLKTQS